MTAPTPDTLRQIAARIVAGTATHADAVSLEWAAMQWRRVERTLDEITDDAMEQARMAEAEAHARREAMRSPVIIRFPDPTSGRMRVGGGAS